MGITANGIMLAEPAISLGGSLHAPADESVAELPPTRAEDDRPEASPGSPVADIVVGGLAGACALVPIANAWTPGFPFDDAYISFCYALQLATGHGLRLGAGAPPRVEAYSNPLWVLLLAIGHVAGLAIPTWSTILNVLLVAVLAGTTMRLVRTLNPRAPTSSGWPTPTSPTSPVSQGHGRTPTTSSATTPRPSSLVGANLTAATPDDVIYAEDHRMLGYGLSDLLYN